MAVHDAMGRLAADAGRNARVAGVLENTIRRRAAGELLAAQDVIIAHRELLPELETKLRILEGVDAAEREAHSRPSFLDENHSALEGMEVPNFIPGYLLTTLIHRGGQGTVYRTTNERTGREVAVKVLRDGPLSTPDTLARFEREVRVLARLDHPNIVAIHDTGVAAGFRYFVMDYVDGEPLDAFLAQRLRSLDEKLRLFVKICEAVHAAHLHGIIHRDLKPSNIRIDARGEPHILDFGLAKVGVDDTHDWGEHHEVTITGQFVGSFPWASPEQAEGSPDGVDLRTDIYSLGVMLFSLLTDRFPYPVVGNMRDVLTHILETEPVRPRSVCKGLDEDIETIVLKCLSKQAEHRYQSVKVLSDDIGRYLNRQPILARAPSSIYQLKKLIVRHKVPVALLLTLFLTVSGLAVGMSVLYRRAAASRDRAQRAEVLAEDRRLRAEREAETAKAVRDYLVIDMLSAVKPELARGRKITVEEVLDHAAARIDEAFRNQPANEASIRATVGQVYFSLGRFDVAEDQMRQAEALFMDLFGEDHVETLRVRCQLIHLLTSLGRFEEADGLSTDTLRRCRNVLGMDHELSLEVAFHYANVLESRWRMAEAAQLAAETLEGRRRLHGDQHSATLASLDQWASLAKRDPGQRAELEALLREMLNGARQTLGENHPQTLGIMTNLGSVLRDQRRFEEAEPLLRLAYEGLRTNLGEEHPTLVVAMRNWGLLLREMNRIDESAEITRHAVALARQKLGDEHPLTLDARYYQATDLFREGRYIEAASILEDVWTTQCRVAGESHERTAQTLAALGYAWFKLGRYADAEAHLRQSMDIHRQNPTGSRMNLMWSLRQLAGTLSGQGKFDQARPFAEELLELRRQDAEKPDADAHALNSYAWELLTVGPQDLRDPAGALKFALLGAERSADSYHYNRYTIALAYESLGQLHMGLEYARRALAHTPLANSSEREDYEAAFVRMLEHAGDPVAAEEVYRDTLIARRELFSHDHPDVAAGLFNLGHLLTEHGKHAEAEPLLRESLEIREGFLFSPESDRFRGTLECDIGKTRTILGECLFRQDEFTQAEGFLREAYDHLQSFGLCHPDLSREASEQINQLYDAWNRTDAPKEWEDSVRRRGNGK
jgi:serine/threonine protein kinase/Tfp pilus assembly protein PilF